MSPRSSAHADGIPTDGCSAVSDSRGPPKVRNGWKAAIQAAQKSIDSHRPKNILGRCDNALRIPGFVSARVVIMQGYATKIENCRRRPDHKM